MNSYSKTNGTGKDFVADIGF